METCRERAFLHDPLSSSAHLPGGRSFCSSNTVGPGAGGGAQWEDAWLCKVSVTLETGECVKGRQAGRCKALLRVSNFSPPSWENEDLRRRQVRVKQDWVPWTSQGAPLSPTCTRTRLPGRERPSRCSGFLKSLSGYLSQPRPGAEPPGVS